MKSFISSQLTPTINSNTIFYIIKYCPEEIMRKYLKWCLVPILVLLFTTCLSPSGDNNGETTLSIALPGGGSESGKNAWLTNPLKFEVSGTGPGGQSFIESASGGTVITVKIVPGLWQIYVKAFDTLTPSIIEADSKTISINAIAGQNNKSEIQMRFCRTNLIENYLNDMSGASPVSLHLAMELSDSNWDALLIAIDNAGKDVSLNLSACTRGPSGITYGLTLNGVFDPNPIDPIGKDRIVSLVLPEATEGIANGTGSSATFEYFNSLTEITIGGNITIIGDYAFKGINLERVTIGNSVTTIGDNAFMECLLLSSVSLGNGIATIGDYAFYNNSQLTRISIPNSVTSIGDHAFKSCDLTELTIGNSVQIIGQFAFSDNTHLERVIIPNSVTNIDSYAFYNCSLNNLAIGNHVTYINAAAFSDNEITGEIIIPDSVNSIGDSAFFNNEITKITIPDNITIGLTAFFNNNNLTTVIFKGDNIIFYNSTFPGSLDGVFNVPGGGAGTYVYDGTTWVKQP